MSKKVEGGKTDRELYDINWEELTEEELELADQLAEMMLFGGSREF